MPFPDLVASENAALHSAGTGTPDNGNNTFNLGLPVDKVETVAAQSEDRIVLNIFPLGPSVTGATFVSRNGAQVTVNFTQGGADQARVECQLIHSSIW